MILVEIWVQKYSQLKFVKFGFVLEGTGGSLL